MEDTQQFRNTSSYCNHQFNLENIQNRNCTNRGYPKFIPSITGRGSSRTILLYSFCSVWTGLCASSPSEFNEPNASPDPVLLEKLYGVTVFLYKGTSQSLFYCCGETPWLHNLYKRKHWMGALLSLSGLVTYHHSEEHGAGAVARNLYLIRKQSGKNTNRIMWALKSPKPHKQNWESDLIYLTRK